MFNLSGTFRWNSKGPHGSRKYPGTTGNPRNSQEQIENLWNKAKQNNPAIPKLTDSFAIPKGPTASQNAPGPTGTLEIHETLENM